MHQRRRIVACLLAFTVSDALALGCGQDTASRFDLPAGTGELSVAVAHDAPIEVLLEVREAGQDLVLDAPAPQRTAQVPPRHGVTVFSVREPIRLTIRRLRPGRGVGGVELRMYCESRTAAAVWQWFARVDQLAARMQGGVGSLRDDFPEALLGEVERGAIDTQTRALAVHLRAQALLLAGRAADASAAFMRAAQAWQAIGDSARASAARVGVAEDLNRSGAYESVLTLARTTPTMPDGSHYFGVRLENARCLALHYLRRLDQATACYAWTSARFDALDETLELASTGIDFAAVEQARGEVDGAEKLLRASLDLARGAQALTVQGRAQFALAGLGRDRGDIAQALQWLQQAQERFTVAAEPRWRANVLLRLAALLYELRAPGDARAAIEQALALLDPQHAPARVAAAQLLLARIELADGRTGSGLRAVEAALQAYRDLGMSEEQTLASLLQARLLLHGGRADAARVSVAGVAEAVTVRSPAIVAQHILLRAELALHDGDVALARAALHGSKSELSWREQLERDRLLAVIEFTSGHADRAHAALRARALELAALAGATGNPLLAHVLLASRDELRRSAVDIIGSAIAAADANQVQAVTRLVPWLLDAEAGVAEDASGTAFDPTLDSALSRTLLDAAGRAAAAAAPAMQDALLATLARRAARRAGRGAPQPVLTVAALRALATPDRPLLALLQGHTELLRLWLDARGVARLDRLPLAEVEDRVARLRALLRNADASLAAIDVQARALSTLLFRDLREHGAPARLQVLGKSLASAVPWPLLYWPGDEQPLAARGSVSLLRLVAQEGRPAGMPTRRIEVLIAEQGDSAANALPILGGASIEPALITRALPTRDVSASTITDLASVLAQLAEPGAWLHLSAHGLTRNDRLAASGIWLNPQSKSGGPQFLGWADLLARGVAADLVVLNACALAPGDAPASAALDFAGAVSRAGARHTIAAQASQRHRQCGLGTGVLSRARRRRRAAGPRRGTGGSTPRPARHPRLPASLPLGRLGALAARRGSGRAG